MPDVLRDLYDDDHEAFRESIASFVDNEMVPNYLDWEAAGLAPRELFADAGPSKDAERHYRIFRFPEFRSF